MSFSLDSTFLMTRIKAPTFYFDLKNFFCFTLTEDYQAKQASVLL